MQELTTTPAPVATMPDRMSSLEIAELTNKQHSNVMRDIRNMTQALQDSRLNPGPVLMDPTGKFVCELASYQSKRQRYPMYLLNIAFAKLILERFQGLARVPNRLQEEAALKTIEQLLGVSLIRQFSVARHRIDGYDAVNNIAYEIDEPGGHGGSTQLTLDKARQAKLSAILGCRFVRINL